MSETIGTGLPELDETVRLMFDEKQVVQLSTDEKDADAFLPVLHLGVLDKSAVLRVGDVELELEPSAATLLGALLVAIAKELEVRGG